MFWPFQPFKLFYMPNPLHHLHLRKRRHIDKQPYPHPDQFKHFVDHAIYIIGVLAPLMGGTQAYKIWSEKTAAGVALPFFAFNIFANIFWLTYGILHREKPIIIMYSLWLIVNIFIVVGTILYS